MFQAPEHAPLELFTNSLSAQTQSTWSDLKLDRQAPSIVWAGSVSSMRFWTQALSK